MSIEFSRSYKTSDGECHATLKEAQASELEIILRKISGDLENVSVESTVKYLVENAEQVVDVLTTTDKSRPKARAVNGGRKARKPKVNPGLLNYTETKRPDGVTPKDAA